MCNKIEEKVLCIEHIRRKIHQLKVSKHIVELALIAFVLLELVYNILWLELGLESEYIVDIQFVLLPFASSKIKYVYQCKYFKPLLMYGMYTLGKQLLINCNVININSINFTDILITMGCLFYMLLLIAYRMLINIKIS